MAQVKELVTGKTLMSLVAVLVAADIMVRSNTPVSRAEGLPDTGAQFQKMVDELKTVNRKLDTLQDLLSSGNLTVKTKSLDEKPAK